jgi:adenine-specific DNA-methyltransferase
MAKKDYSSSSKEELLEVIGQLETTKKYGLVWDQERVPEDIVTECYKNLPVLEEIKDKSLLIDQKSPTHILIQGDNFHALSVLNYTHKGKIDLIYIDPPYNTGKKDWKYNNNYVDKIDTWRHSKWIQFMFNRLKLAKNLLKDNGALICAIDHNEQENLGILLREMFANKEIVCVTIVHNPRGIQGDDFSSTHEYAYFVYPHKDYINPIKRDEEDWEWEPFRNWGGDSERSDGKSMFYPISFKDGKIVDIGSMPPDTFTPEKSFEIVDDDVIKVWPIDENKIARKWRYSVETLKANKDRIRLEKIQNYYQVQVLKDSDRPKTVWTDTKYDANKYGTQLLSEIIDKKFPFPKSLHTVKDCIELVVKNNPDAVILDYFAGSGTTGHAVLEINKELGGNRKFILCTNNESNICEDITYPRIRNIIEGYKFEGKIEEVLIEKKITYTLLRRGNVFATEVEDLIEEKRSEYDRFEKKTDKGIFKLIGIKNIKGLREGYGGNLRYYQSTESSFIKNNLNRDQLKFDISQKCTEMLCLKESIYDLFDSDEFYKIFTENNRTLAVYYDFAGLKLEELRNKLSKINGEKTLYCFTLSSDVIDIINVNDWSGVKLEPIPEKILDIYKSIFNNK